MNGTMKANLKRGQQHPLKASLEINAVNLRHRTSRSCFLLTSGAAGVGRPFGTLPIGDCQLPNGAMAVSPAIGNRHLAIEKVL